MKQNVSMGFPVSCACSEHKKCRRLPIRSDCVKSLLIPPSTSASGQNRKSSLFSDEEKDEIGNLCEDIIKSGAISLEKVSNAMQKSIFGSRILEKFRLDQIQGRVKYERRQIRTKK